MRTNNYSSQILFSASTDGHVVLWPFPTPRPDNNIISYNSRIRIHQSGIISISCISLSESAKLVVTGGDNGELGILLLASSFSPESQDGVEEPTKGEERELLLIPGAHAAAITAVIYLRSSPLSSCSFPWHFFATISTDQLVKIWRIRTRLDSASPADDDKGNNAKRKKVIVIEVDKVREMHSIVCDAAASAAAVVHHYHTPQQTGDHDDDDDEEEKAEGQQQLGGGNIVLIVAGIGIEVFDLGCSLEVKEG